MREAKRFCNHFRKIKGKGVGGADYMSPCLVHFSASPKGIVSVEQSTPGRSKGGSRLIKRYIERREVSSHQIERPTSRMMRSGVKSLTPAAAETRESNPLLVSFWRRLEIFPSLVDQFVLPLADSRDPISQDVQSTL